MNKADFVTEIATKTEMSKKDTNTFVDAFISTVTGALTNGDKVQLVGFGTFDVADRDARQGRNPATGETINIPAKKVPKFKASKTLKDAVNA